jgi:hypothetical protein
MEKIIREVQGSRQVGVAYIRTKMVIHTGRNENVKCTSLFAVHRGNLGKS